MKLKSINVDISNLCKEIKDELPSMEKRLKLVEGKDFEMVITSGNDGKHMPGSLHYSNKAIDIRKSNMKNPDHCWLMIRKQMGHNIDVVMEKDHIHIEYDLNRFKPKKK